MKYPVIYITDRDGIERNKPQLPLLRKLAEHVRIWVEPGIRYADNIIDFIIAGASDIVLSTSTIAGLREVREALEISPNIIFCIDYNLELDILNAPDSFTQGYRIEELIQEVVRWGVTRIIVTLSDEPGNANTISPQRSRGDYDPPFPPNLKRPAPSGNGYRLLKHITRSIMGTGPQDLILVAKGPHAWAQREWLWQNGWASVVTDIHYLE